MRRALDMTAAWRPAAPWWTLRPPAPRRHPVSRGPPRARLPYACVTVRRPATISAEGAVPTAHGTVEELFTELEVADCLCGLKNRKEVDPGSQLSC